MKKFKNIIFDLGGVIIDIERQNAAAALKGLGVADAEILLGEYEQKGPFLLLETGEMTVGEFYDRLLPLCRPGTLCSEIQQAFECFLTRIPPERLLMLDALRKKGYRLFVLSNTNPLMFNHWIDLAFRQEGKSINDYFDGIVVSFQEKVCKPTPLIMKNLLERYDLDPSETLFLDDSAANCEMGRGLGTSAIQIQKTGQDSFEAVCSNLLEDKSLQEGTPAQ